MVVATQVEQDADPADEDGTGTGHKPAAYAGDEHRENMVRRVNAEADGIADPGDGAAYGPDDAKPVDDHEHGGSKKNEDSAREHDDDECLQHEAGHG